MRNKTRRGGATNKSRVLLYPIFAEKGNGRDGVRELHGAIITRKAGGGEKKSTTI